MLGAIIGDIVGSRWEFNPTNDYNFEWLSAENGFTDDTICTVAGADALLHGRDFRESIHDWCRRYPNPMGGYGGRFYEWVHSDNPQPYDSFGNGACMRPSPVGHWFNNEKEALDAAAATAIVSHDHPEGVKGAQTVVLAIHKAMQYNREGYQEAAMHIDEIIDECVKFSGYHINMSKASVLNRFDVTSQGTMPVALKIISMSRNFEDAVRLAVSLGADADTLGAIVGSIAEAIWGIPIEIRNQIERYLPYDMLRVVIDFYNARPDSYKPLVDMTFSKTRFSDSSLELLESEERDELHDIIKSKNNDKLMLMAERAKAREKW